MSSLSVLQPIEKDRLPDREGLGRRAVSVSNHPKKDGCPTILRDPLTFIKIFRFVSFWELNINLMGISLLSAFYLKISLAEKFNILPTE